MCFSETQSYINTILLISTALYLLPNFRLSASLIFLAFKDLLQGLSYKNIEYGLSTYYLTVLSWIHISLQPFFVNLFISHFDKKFKYWNHIFFLCLLFSLFCILRLETFNIQNNKKCIKKNMKNDFCSNKTQSYIGKYHIGYQFSTDKYYPYAMIFYNLLMFIPGLFTKSKNLALTWGLGVLLIVLPLYNKIGTGEINAMWCFLSILFALPVALFHKKISLLIK